MLLFCLQAASQGKVYRIMRPGLRQGLPFHKKVMPLQHEPENGSGIATNDVAALAQDGNNDIRIVHRNGIIENWIKQPMMLSEGMIKSKTSQKAAIKITHCL